MPRARSDSRRAPVFRSTTILCVLRDGRVVMGGDGQVTQNDTILKTKARKVRRLYDDRVLAGFAGATADALALFELFEAKLKDYSGNLRRAAVELAKEWRTDRKLRNLNALMIVADAERMLLVTGVGDVIEPDDGVIAVGSGATVATGVARALLEHTTLDAEAIVREAMKLTAELDVYTNDQLVVEVLGPATPG
jgi:ATP-dependent HslUV protease subunit HslV